jgi:hypothetical protein
MARCGCRLADHPIALPGICIHAAHRGYSAPVRVEPFWSCGRGSRLPAASPTDRLFESSSSLERVARSLIGAIERGAGFRQNRH